MKALGRVWEMVVQVDTAACVCVWCTMIASSDTLHWAATHTYNVKRMMERMMNDPHRRPSISGCRKHAIGNACSLYQAGGDVYACIGMGGVVWRNIRQALCDDIA